MSSLVRIGEHRERKTRGNVSFIFFSNKKEQIYLFDISSPVDQYEDFLMRKHCKTPEMILHKKAL